MPANSVSTLDVRIGDLLDLPPRVHKGDFVLNLAEGITRPKETLDQYVITDQLVACFDNALGFIRAALDSRTSKAAYLHGMLERWHIDLGDTLPLAVEMIIGHATLPGDYRINLRKT